MTRYLVSEARSLAERPSWTLEYDGEISLFAGVKNLDKHPFAYRDNLIFILSAGLNFDIEALNALIERRHIDVHELTSEPRNVGEVIVSNPGNIRILT